MKIALLILTHKDPVHLKRLINACNHPHVDIYLHIDKKSNFHEEINKWNDTKLNNRITVIPSSNVKWASISQTVARLELMKYAQNKGAYSHYIMISGQCYPIKPITQIVNKLKHSIGTSFIQHEAIPTPLLGINEGLDRIECYSYNILGKKVTYFTRKMNITFNRKGEIINALLSFIHIFKKKRSFPNYIKAYYGIDWWVLSSEAVNYIIDFAKSHPDYHQYNVHTRHTCEIYFPSILAGTDYKGLLVNESPHFMIWDKENSAHPIILKENNFDEIYESNALFARKFESSQSSELIKRINVEILDIDNESK
jgi:hypothetical protein